MTVPGTSIPPFPENYRASGILMHVTSLPSPYGIGDFGPSALAFVDRLAQAGQSWWQVLPLNPTGLGNSPYSSSSTFAANGLLISPDWLIEDGLLSSADCAPPPLNTGSVDYATVIPFKTRLLDTAWNNYKVGARSDLRSTFERFCTLQSHWLEDYGLFLALRDKFDGANFLLWPKEFLERDPVALDRVRRELSEQIGSICFTQFLAFRQGERLKSYAHGKGVGLIGDLPFYVSPDSTDAWTHPEVFLLDENRRPRVVGGVPPDYFSADGQLWGDSVYNWEALGATGYLWWVRRLRALLAHVDMIRLDHFRAFAAAWHIPADSPTAKTGDWAPGPGANFFREVGRQLGGLPFIAEDLGQITPDVYTLRDDFRLPGMRVLQFAFDGLPGNPHRAETYVHDAVVFTGTHDNPTTRGWFETLRDDERADVWKYLRERGAKSDAIAHAMIEVAWTSNAALAMAPLQDLLNLGKEARMNVPGVAEGNWCWRCNEEMLNSPVFEWLGDVTESASRSKALPAARERSLETASGLD